MPADSTHLATPVERPPDGAARTLAVILPAYDEAAVIRHSVTAVAAALAGLGPAWHCEIVVVDDGSRDRTAALAAELAAGRDDLRLLRHAANRGLGAALRTGFAATAAEFVAVLDMDLSYAPDHLGPLLDALDRADADIAVASPYMPGGRVAGVPWRRRLLSRAANWYLSRMMGGRLRTLTGMVRVYRGATLRCLDLTAEGKDINIEIVERALQAGARFVEVPARLAWLAPRGGRVRLLAETGKVLRRGLQLRRLAQAAR